MQYDMGVEYLQCV